MMYFFIKTNSEVELKNTVEFCVKTIFVFRQNFDLILAKPLVSLSRLTQFSHHKPR